MGSQYSSSRKRGDSRIFSILSLLFFFQLLTAQLACVQAQVRNCSQTPSDCELGRTYFNQDTGCCETCNACDGHEEMIVAAQCNRTHNAVCDCNFPLFPFAETCIINCLNCPRGCDDDLKHCVCERPECHSDSDIYCRVEDRCLAPISPETDKVDDSRSTVGPNSAQDTFPAWGFGLIAIGVVIGIIIFASCFLCMGIFSNRSSHDPESHPGSESSENGLVLGGSFVSVGTNSSYLSRDTYPYLTSHSMLELLKNSNPPLIVTSNGLSSLHGSPVSSRNARGQKPVLLGSLSSSSSSSRDSPRPCRTEKVPSGMLKSASSSLEKKKCTVVS